MEMTSCDVSDACDATGIGAVRTGTLRPVWHGCPPVHGRVATFRLLPAGEAVGPDGTGAGPASASAYEGYGPGSASDPVRELIAGLETAGGADIVLLDIQGRTDLQCWGGMMARAAARCGFGAALVHGAVRDVAELERLRFPVYATGVHPARARGRLVYAGAGAGVRLERGRPAVADGWAVAADASGAVFLPGGSAEGVFASAREAAADAEEATEAVEAVEAE